MPRRPSEAPPPLSVTAHPRTFRQNRYVYPVLSRRAGGISVGINLNPDQACNFACIYCQVDRSSRPVERFVELDRLRAELRAVLTGLQPGGALWATPQFSRLPAGKHLVKDLAFSGDGEPTTFRNFSEVVRAAVEIKEARGFADAKVVLITNATGLNRPDVRQALRFLDAHRGEVWAKLDAGTPTFFRFINGTRFPFRRLLATILACARERSIVIQSCFMRIRNASLLARGRGSASCPACAGPSPDEITAYIARLNELTAAGARIHLVQVCTLARPPARHRDQLASLSRAEVDAIAARVRAEAGLNAAAFYGEVAETKARGKRTEGKR